MLKYIYPLFLFLVLAACSSKKASQERIINVTIEPERYLAEAIVGDKYKVNTIVPKGSNPEIYEPSPEQLIKLSEGSIYLRIGQIGFEQIWMTRIRQNAPDMHIYDLSEGIIKPEKGKYVDPHIWTSVVNMQIMAQHLVEILAKEDPENGEFYRKRAATLIAELKNMDRDFRKVLKNIPNRSFLIYHPTLTYFAKDYGLDQIAIEKEDKEPTPFSIKETINECKRKNVRLILLQKEFDIKNTQLIARQLNAGIVQFDPLAYDWPETMRQVVTAIANPEKK